MVLAMLLLYEVEIKQAKTRVRLPAGPPKAHLDKCIFDGLDKDSIRVLVPIWTAREVVLVKRHKTAKCSQ